MSGWIRFEDRGRSFQPKATVSANGYIAISQGGCTRFNLTDRFKGVVLFFNPETREIGIQPVEEDTEPGARKLRFREMGVDFSAAPFLDRFDIRPVTTTRHTLTQDAETGFLVIKLDDGKPRKRGSGKPSENGGEK